MAKRKRHRKRTPVGAPPGTLVPDPASRPTRIAYFSYDKSGLVEKAAATPGELAEAIGGHAVVWVDVHGLADLDLIARLGDTFGLHRLAIEDVVNVHQRPKLEEYDDHLFIVTRMLEDPGSTATEQLSIFLGAGYVLTFQERPGDVFEPVRKRLRQHKGRLRELGADYLAYSLIDAVIDGYFPSLEHRGEILEELEDRVVSDPRADHVSSIHQMKRDLLELRRAVWPQREMLSLLMRVQPPLVTAPTQVYLRDCYDHTFQLIDMIETYREIASSLIEIHLSSLSYKMNEIMKVLTIIATIFIPLSFVTGLYGMNFDPKASPWNMPELGWTFGYPFALAVMAAIAAGLLYFFWRRGWLGKED
jgi:magnesium transporter